MMDWIDPEAVKSFARHTLGGMLGAGGGVIGYLMDVQRGKIVFKWFGYAVFTATAFFLGVLLMNLLPDSLPGKGGVIGVSGTVAYAAIDALRARALAVIEKQP